MATVYLVREGEYSDTHTVAIFSRKEDAELCQRALTRPFNTPEIEEYELDPFVHKWRAGLRTYRVRLNANTGMITTQDEEGGVWVCSLGEANGRHWIGRAHSHRDCPKLESKTKPGTWSHDYNNCLFREAPYTYNDWPERLRPYVYDFFETTVWARDETHAVKIAHERWMQWKALQG